LCYTGKVAFEVGGLLFMRIHRSLLAPGAAALLLVLAVWPASAKILITVDKSTQRMTVSQDGSTLYTWPVSTGVQRYDTPNGSFTPSRMAKTHFSREWDNAPMPNSIFFTERGHAIHGTSHTSIGRPASHGCVRLSLANARTLFELVKREGMSNTTVVLSGTLPSVETPAMARHTPARSRNRTRTVERHIDSDDDDFITPPRRPLYGAPRGYARQPGYWLRYPDGTRVYYGGEQAYRRMMGPPPVYIGRRSGWV
jgi:hypothetical protein